MNKKLIISIVLVITIALTVFVAPNFNFAILDSQCKTSGCSGQICSTSPLSQGTICDWIPEYGCNKDCKVRNFRCSFDQEFKQNCLDCIQDCRTKFDLETRDASIYQEFGDCTAGCYEE